MITIRIANVEQVVEQQKGWLAAHVGGAFVDLRAKVEGAIIEKLRESLAAQGVEAVIEQVPEE